MEEVLKIYYKIVVKDPAKERKVNKRSLDFLGLTLNSRYFYNCSKCVSACLAVPMPGEPGSPDMPDASRIVINFIKIKGGSGFDIPDNVIDDESPGSDSVSNSGCE